MSSYLLTSVPHGFRWGPATVQRITDDPKWGVVLHVTTERQQLEVRVTPSGLIRVGSIQKVSR